LAPVGEFLARKLQHERAKRRIIAQPIRQLAFDLLLQGLVLHLAARSTSDMPRAQAT
jgi:hypothetical protein